MTRHRRRKRAPSAMGTVQRLALVAGATVAMCGVSACGDGPRESPPQVTPTAPGVTVSNPQPPVSASLTPVATAKGPAAEPERVSSVGPAGPAATPPATLTEGKVGPKPTPTGREAPDAASGPLRFRPVRVFPDASTGRTAVATNLTNAGTAFLNNITVSWRLVGPGGTELDAGSFTWPGLAPGETATATGQGRATYGDRWELVEFTYRP